MNYKTLQAKKSSPALFHFSRRKFIFCKSIRNDQSNDKSV